jgi:hypothetical protein
LEFPAAIRRRPSAKDANQSARHLPGRESIFVFSPQDVAAIIDYLESIQEKPDAPAEEAQ